MCEKNCMDEKLANEMKELLKKLFTRQIKFNTNFK